MIHKRFSLFFFIRDSHRHNNNAWLDWYLKLTLTSAKNFLRWLGCCWSCSWYWTGRWRAHVVNSLCAFFVCMFHLNKVSWLSQMLRGGVERARVHDRDYKRAFLHKLQKFYIHRLSVRAHRNLIKLERICNRSPTRADVEKFPKDFSCIFLFIFSKKTQHEISTFHHKKNIVHGAAAPCNRGKVIFNAAYQCYEFSTFSQFSFLGALIATAATLDYKEQSRNSFYNLICRLAVSRARSSAQAPMRDLIASLRAIYFY